MNFLFDLSMVSTMFKQQNGRLFHLCFTWNNITLFDIANLKQGHQWFFDLFKWLLTNNQILDVSNVSMKKNH